MTEREMVAGRKIFLIDLPENLQNELLNHIIRKEYEVYVFDSPHFNDIIAEYSRSFFIIYTDTENTGPDFWKAYLRDKADMIARDDFRFLFCSDNKKGQCPSPEETCVDLSAGITETALQRIFDELDAEHSKGQRKYVRFGAQDDINVAFSFTVQNKEVTGNVYDISSAGMSCAFDKETALPINATVSKIKLTIKNRSFEISGKTILQRRLDSDKKLFVVMFDRRMPRGLREVLQDFIHLSLQTQLERKLEISHHH